MILRNILRKALTLVVGDIVKSSSVWTFLVFILPSSNIWKALFAAIMTGKEPETCGKYEIVKICTELFGKESPAGKKSAKSNNL